MRPANNETKSSDDKFEKKNSQNSQNPIIIIENN